MRRPIGRTEFSDDRRPNGKVFAECDARRGTEHAAGATHIKEVFDWLLDRMKRHLSGDSRLPSKVDNLGSGNLFLYAGN